MSLRAFHIIFVTVTVLLSLFVAAWGFRQYSHGGDTAALALAVLFLVTACAGVLYGRKMFVKLRDLG